MSGMKADDFRRFSVADLQDSIECRLRNGMSSCQNRSGQPEYDAAPEAAAAIRVQSEKIVNTATAPLLTKITQLEETQARLEYAFSLLQLRQSLETADEHNPDKSTAVS